MLAKVKPYGRIKTRPEDFVVQEVVAGKIVQPVFKSEVTPSEGAPLTLFTLTKRLMSGEAAYREVARQLGVAREAITDHGLKDACAVTSQQIVVEGEYTPAFEHDQIWLRRVGDARKSLRHGAHDGNRFIVKVWTDASVAPREPKFLNLFGAQRFGDGTFEVGKHLLEGNFEQALALLRNGMNWRTLKPLIDQGLSAEAALLHEDFRFELKFKLGQWISWLWNQLAEETSARSLPTWSYGASDHLYNKWWNPDELDGEMLDLTHSFVRPVRTEARNVQVIKRQGYQEHQFALRSGAYATVYLGSLYELIDESRS